MPINALRTNIIRLYVIVNDQQHLLETYPHEYRNLMMLIYDKLYVEDFGDCKGMGRCGTCHIAIMESAYELNQKIRNENTTLGKMPNVTSMSRLSCQIPVDESLNNAVVRIVSE